MWTRAAWDPLATKMRVRPPDMHTHSFPVPCRDLFWACGLLSGQADVRAYLRFPIFVTSSFMQNVGLDKITHCFALPCLCSSLLSNISWMLLGSRPAAGLHARCQTLVGRRSCSQRCVHRAAVEKSTPAALFCWLQVWLLPACQSEAVCGSLRWAAGHGHPKRFSPRALLACPVLCVL